MKCFYAGGRSKTAWFSFTETLLCHSKATQVIKSKWGQESLHSISTMRRFQPYDFFSHYSPTKWYRWEVKTLTLEYHKCSPTSAGIFLFLCGGSCANVNLASQTVPRIRHGCEHHHHPPTPPPTPPALAGEKSFRVNNDPTDGETQCSSKQASK